MFPLNGPANPPQPISRCARRFRPGVAAPGTGRPKFLLSLAVRSVSLPVVGESGTARNDDRGLTGRSEI
jgi:hypothetical protein